MCLIGPAFLYINIICNYFRRSWQSAQIIYLARKEL